jgi:hypothetical protein
MTWADVRKLAEVQYRRREKDLVSPTNSLLRKVKAMSTKAEKAEAAAEARAEAKAERLAEDKAAVAEQAAPPEAPPETGISATPVLHAATGERREGTHTREAVNGFVEVIDTATGDVVARYEQGTPKPD